MVIAVLAVAHGGELIEMNAATTSRDQKVGEPIVVDDLASAIDSHEESAGGMVKDHGVATGDVLGESVLKTRRPRIIRGEADGLVLCIDHAGATAIEARDVGRDGSQEGDCSLKFIGFPDVILIGVGVKVGLDVCMRDQGEKVGNESLPGTVMDGQALFSPTGLILQEDLMSVIGGSVVGCPNLPIPVGLCCDGVKLIGEEFLPLKCTQQDRNLGFGWIYRGKYFHQRNLRKAGI
jgi:hypothetical protein